MSMKPTSLRMRLVEAARRLSELDREREEIRRFFPELLEAHRSAEMTPYGTRPERRAQGR